MGSREDKAARKSHSVHEPLRQAEGAVVIATNDPDLIYFSKNLVSIDMLVDFIEDESQEDQGKPEGGGVLTPQNGAIIDLSFTASSVIMSMYNIVDEYVLTIAPVDHTEP